MVTMAKTPVSWRDWVIRNALKKGVQVTPESATDAKAHKVLTITDVELDEANLGNSIVKYTIEPNHKHTCRACWILDHTNIVEVEQ